MKLRLPGWTSFLFVLLLSDVQAGWQTSSSTLFAEGNAQYQKGDYGAAERSYHQLVDAGVDSGTVYYNLGNACFKQKKLGEAIYFWEKARQKFPADPEIHENLQLANLLLVDRIDVPASPLAIRLLDNAIHRLTIQQDSWIALALFITTNSLLGSYFLVRRARRRVVCLLASFVTATFFLLFGCSLAWKIYETKYRQEGIIIQDKVDIRSGPGAESITVFTVHEGIKVRVRGEAAGWYQVSLPNGWVGWLEKNSVSVL